MKRLVWLLLLAGCTVEPNGTGIDGGDLGSPTSLCTTPACAQSPCGGGCVFAAPPCTATLTTTVSTSTVTACAGFCGLFTVSNALGCGVYQGNLDGCQVCGYRWGAASCVAVSPMIDYQTGGAICSSCFDGRAPQDMAPSPPCDTPDAWIRD